MSISNLALLPIATSFDWISINNPVRYAMKQPDNHRSKNDPGKSVLKAHLQFPVARRDSAATLVNPIDTPVTESVR